MKTEELTPAEEEWIEFVKKHRKIFEKIAKDVKRLRRIYPAVLDS